ncbi:MAG: discoidin domain-containing protein [Armatimonadota bacterium]|nr:discoidin domain-containing protein [Armatimonadota bacterium]
MLVCRITPALLYIFFAISGVPSFAAVIADIPMDRQINLGQGDAITPLYGSVLTFQPAAPPDEPDGWARLNIVVGGGAGSWFYGPCIDFVKAGIGPLNLTDPTVIYYLGVKCRYYQDPATNTRPYAEAPIYFRLYTYDDSNTIYKGFRDYGVFYGPTGESWFPTWTYKTFPLTEPTIWPYTESGSFNPAKVHRCRFYGKDTYGKGSDFVDVKSFQIYTVPKPRFVRGMVKDESGKPIKGAVVGIKASRHAAADPLFYKVTDSSGAYEFKVDPGTYYVAAWRYGYLPTPDTVVTVQSSDVKVQDLILDDKANANIAPAYSALYATSEDPAGQMGKEQGADGNFSTRWTTANPLPDSQQDQSWIVDFGTSRTITGVTIFWENAYPSDYSIEVTNDDPSPWAEPTWTVIYSATGSNGGWYFGYAMHAEPFRFDPPITARGVRFHVTKFGPYPVYSCWEFQIHGTEPGHAFSRISEVKQLPDNTPVELLKWVSVSGVYNGGESNLFRDTFWLEEEDRSCGIRVEAPGHYCWPGELDQVSGTVQTDSATGERYIQATSVGYFADLGATPAPHGMTVKSMLETDLPWGLLVKTAGKVIGHEPDGYLLSDGSAQPVKVVKEEPLPPIGAFVVVEGALKSGPLAIYEQKGNVDGFIRQWLMNGGYCVDDPLPGQGMGDPNDFSAKWNVWQGLNLATDFLASQGGEANISPKFGDRGPNGGVWFGYSRKPWESYLFGLNNPPVPWVPTNKAMICAYASTWVLADRVYDGMNDGLEIWVGSDDGYKIWVNGTPIGENNIWRGVPPVEAWDRYPALSWEGDLYSLQPGWNHILIKVNNIYGGYGFGVRLMRDNGANPLVLPYYSAIEYPYNP